MGAESSERLESIGGDWRVYNEKPRGTKPPGVIIVILFQAGRRVELLLGENRRRARFRALGIFD